MTQLFVFTALGALASATGTVLSDKPTTKVGTLYASLGGPFWLSVGVITYGVTELILKGQNL
jgi:ABC-type sugar transport system substrate-binding protein